MIDELTPEDQQKLFEWLAWQKAAAYFAWSVLGREPRGDDQIRLCAGPPSR
jgi:hypothetical protein